MRINLLLIIACSAFLLSCTSNHSENEIKAIKSVMENQSLCWSNGDIDGFMDGYWKSDSLGFLGSRGLTRGWSNTLANYKKGYPNRAAMGKLIFNYISFEPLGKNNMLVIGKWTLEREEDTLRGYYSLVWKKIEGEWKITFDHTN
jgi:hypothetical protein